MANAARSSTKKLTADGLFYDAVVAFDANDVERARSSFQAILDLFPLTPFAGEARLILQGGGLRDEIQAAAIDGDHADAPLAAVPAEDADETSEVDAEELLAST